MKISAIVPCLNEELNINPLYDKITKALADYEDYEVIFIDDGSTDGTLSLIKKLASKDDKVKYISFTRNFGMEAAFRYGYLYASYEWCIHYDADLQWPPEDTWKLTQKAEQGYDAVFGIRKTRKDKLYRKIGSKGQSFIARKIFQIELPKGASSFRVIKTSVIRKILNYPIKTPYFIATLPLVTDNYATVEVDHNQRLHGKTRFSLGKMIHESCRLFFGFSNRMLNFSAIAFSICTLAFIPILIYVLINPEHANGLLMVFLCIIALIQLLSKAISDQYLKYPNLNYPFHETIFVQESNIESCIKERIH